MRRTRASLKDASINQYDGRLVEENKDWLTKELAVQASDLHSRF